MSQDNELVLLSMLARRNELREQGLHPTDEELCRQHPQLLEEFRTLAAQSDEVEQAIGKGNTPVGDETGPFSPGGTIVVPSSADFGSRLTDVRVLDRGGMGEVLLARDPELNVDVVVKVIRASMASDPGAVTRFLWEASVTARLNHPGIPAVLGVGKVADGRPCYVMRFISGDKMTDAIKAMRDQPADAKFHDLLGRFVTVCRIVAYAHEQGVIHRDLKPDNVRLGTFGETIVLDWGLAKVNGQGVPGIDETGLGMGTPGYMSPEQEDGRQEDVDQRSDVYSLGAILKNIVGNDGPKPLVAVFIKAMAKEPGERYQKAVDLGSEVSRWLADEPLEVHRDRLPIHIARKVRKNPILSTGIASGLAIAVIALVIGIVLIAREEARTVKERDEKELARQAADREKEEKELALAKTIAAKTSATGLLQSSLDIALKQFEKTAALDKDGVELLGRLEKDCRAYSQAGDDSAKDHEVIINGLFRIAVIWHRHEQFVPAERLYKEVIERCKRLKTITNDDPRAREKLIVIHTNFANMLASKRNRSLDADHHFRSALHESEALIEVDGKNKRWRQLHASTSNGYAVFLRAIGRTEEAGKYLRQSLSEFEQLLSAEPRNTSYRRSAAGILYNLANGYGEENFAEAEKFHRRAIDLRRSLVADKPDDALFRGELAQSLTDFGLLLINHGGNIQAEPLYVEAIPLLSKLSAERPGNPFYLLTLGHSRLNLARLEYDRKQFDEAIALLKLAADGYRQLMMARPDNPEYQDVLGYAITIQAKCYVDQRKFAEARKCLEEARLLHEKAIKGAPKVLSYRENLVINRLLYAGLLVETGDHKEAASIANELNKLRVSPDSAILDPASILVRCATLASKDGFLPEAKRTELAETYIKRAMDVLQEGRKLGAFRMAKHFNELKTRKDLDPLRSRDDFKTLLNEIAEDGESNKLKNDTTKATAGINMSFAGMI